MEGLGLAALGVALDAAKAEDRAEGVLREPEVAGLGGEGVHQVFDLAPADRGVEGNVEAGRAPGPVVLGDLVLEDEVVAEGVPGQLSEHAVILVRVAAPRAEHDVRRGAALELLEFLLDGGLLRWKEPVAEL